MQSSVMTLTKYLLLEVTCFFSAARAIMMKGLGTLEEKPKLPKGPPSQKMLGQELARDIAGWDHACQTVSKVHALLLLRCRPRRLRDWLSGPCAGGHSVVSWRGPLSSAKNPARRHDTGLTAISVTF